MHDIAREKIFPATRVARCQEVLRILKGAIIMSVGNLLAVQRKEKLMKLTKNQAKRIRALKRMKDEDIDFSDIPELRGDEKFVVGKFYRPIKKLVNVRKSTNKKLEANNALNFTPQ